MRSPFKIKFLLRFLMAFLLTCSGVTPVLAAVTAKDAGTSSVSFLLQGVSGDLHLQDVQIAYDVSYPGNGNLNAGNYQSIDEPNAVMTATDNGYLVTIPQVDWSKATKYQVLIQTDQDFWRATITQADATNGPQTLSFNQLVQISPDIGDSVLPGLQLQKMVLYIGPFQVPVAPGQSVPLGDYYQSLLFGYKDDAVYFANTDVTLDNTGKFTHIVYFDPLTVDSTDPSLSLSGIGMRDSIGPFGSGFEPPQMYVWNPSTLPLKKVFLSGYLPHLLFSFQNKYGYDYVYSAYYCQSCWPTPTYHVDGNLSVKTVPNRVFYHSGDQLNLPQDLGLSVTDSQGHQIVGITDSQGNPIPETLELARNSEDFSYDYNWNESLNTLALPQETGDFTLTYKVPTGPQLHLQAMTTISLVDGLLAPQILPFKDDTNELIGIAEPRWLITLDNDGFIGQVNDDGTFDIQMNQTFKPNTWLHLDFFNPDDPSQSFRVPVLVLARDIKVNPLKDTDRAVTGTAEPGAKITVTTNSKVVGSGIVKKDGTFAVPVSPQQGGEILFVKSHYGTTGINDQTVTIPVKDTTAPLAPKFTHAAPNPDNAYPVTLIEGTGEPLTKLTLSVNGQIVDDGIPVGTDGKFAMNVDPFPVGTIMTATLTDAAGNVSPTTTIIVTNPDGPVAPTIDTPKDTDTKITGHAEPNESITVKVGTRTLGSAQTDANGNFSVSITKQKSYTVLTVVVTDFFKKSNSAQVTVASTVAPAAPRVSSVTHTSTKVIGTTVANATITITINGTLYTGQADKYGRFSITIPLQTKGTVLYVTATDQWGNTSNATKVTVL